MRVRRCPLDHHKGSKQKENKCCVDTLLDHDGIEFEVIVGITMAAEQEFLLYTRMKNLNF